jgi:tetratricopeptide (TPR) repeat protein/DNA-binding MarR family transcriptional regulator
MGAQTYLPIEILDYVETHAPPPDSAYGISQRELAKALGYHPCSMSRPLDSLVKGRLLDAHRGLVRDGRRKQLTYWLTEVGRERLHRETREVPLLSGEIPPPPHPFLGRKDELNQLADFSREARAITFVDGAPGMGKTALISRHLRRIKQGRVPFWFTIRSGSSPRQFVTALSHALSFLGAPQLAYYTQLPRAPVPREVADLAARALGNRSLAVVVDDVQLANPDLRSFLTEFVLALVKSREDLIFLVGQESPAFDTGSVPSHHLSIGGLDRASAHDLTDRAGGLADRFETVYQSTLGSPLLLKLAVSNPDVEADAATLPTAILKRLPPEEVRAILSVVLANEPLPISFVAELGEVSSGRISDLIHTGLLHKTLQGRVEVLQVVREAVLARVGTADEREAHSRLAVFYSRSHRPEAVRERFLHLVEAESWKLAGQLLDRQERVILRLGYSQAVRNAMRHLVTGLPSGQSRARVLTTEADLLRAHSDYSEAIVALQRAISEGESDSRLVCESLLSIVDLHLRLRQLDQAKEQFANARKIGEVSRRLQAYFALTEARMAAAKGDRRLAQDLYQGAFEMARRFRAPDLALESIVAWTSLAEPGSGPDVALRIIEEALPEARQMGRLDVAFNLMLIRARAYSDMGKEDLAEAEIKSIRSEAESLGYLNQLTYTLSGLASVAIERAQWRDALAYAKQASTLAERLGNELVLGHTLALLCTTEFRQADKGGDTSLLEEAVKHGERSIEVLNRLPPSDSLIFAHAYLTEVYVSRHDIPSAKKNYDRALELAENLQFGWLRDQLHRELRPKVYGGEVPVIPSLAANGESNSTSA